MTQHTSPRAPYYAPLAPRTLVRYRGKRATIASVQNADSIGMIYGVRHTYTVITHGEYGDYTTSRVQPSEITRQYPPRTQLKQQP